MPVLPPKDLPRLVEKSRHISLEDRGTGPFPPSDVAEQESGPQEMIDQSGKVRWLRIATTLSHPMME